VLPPRLAPIQVVIVPIFKNADQLGRINETAGNIKNDLEKMGISVKYDNRDNNTPGWKFADYELKGVPVRLAIGPRDLENKTVEVARRDTLQKQIVALDTINTHIPALLDEIQNNIYNKALIFRNENTHYLDNWKEFTDVLDGKGGFIMAHWDGTPETEEKIKEETKATIRCIPLNSPPEKGKCIYSGKPSERRVLFARSY
jgi:prolyl-tRNA synthetase